MSSFPAEHWALRLEDARVSRDEEVLGWDRSNEGLGQAAAGASLETAQKEAFDELFRRMWRTTVEWSRAAGAPGQHYAEDAATQAWLKAWRYRQNYRPAKGSYGGWLRTIVRNETSDLLKAQNKEAPAGSMAQQTSAGMQPATTDYETGALDFIFDAFRALEKSKPEFANVLSLKAQGYRDRQIADVLGIHNVGTVGSRLWRAKEFIASRLAEKGVVFLAEGIVGTVHPMGLAPFCRTGDGSFYRFSPLSGLFVLPNGSPRPAGSDAVCDGFFVKVWSFPLEQFEVRVQDQTLTEGAIFSWKQFAVYARHRSVPFAAGSGHGVEDHQTEPRRTAVPGCSRDDPHRKERATRFGPVTAVFDHGAAR